MRIQRKGRRRGKAALAAGALLIILVLAAYGYLRARDVGAFQNSPLEYVEEIRRNAAEFSLEPAYVAAVILAESSYNPDAVSHADARGLMQLLPSTAEWIAGKLDESFDATALFEPDTNIRYGCWYLKFLLDRYAGSMRNASAAYHAGQGRVDQWLDDSTYSPDGKVLEVIASDATNTYVNRVLANYAHYQTLY